MLSRIPLVLALGFAADPSANDVHKKDLEKMQGDWALISRIVDGKKAPDDETQVLFRTVKGDQYTVFLFDKPLANGSFKIDASKKPRTIDFQPAAGASQGKPILAIYELSENKCKFCLAAPGKDRPTDFAAKEGSGHTLMVWECEKK